MSKQTSNDLYNITFNGDYCYHMVANTDRYWTKAFYLLEYQEKDILYQIQCTKFKIVCSETIYNFIWRILLHLLLNYAIIVKITMQNNELFCIRHCYLPEVRIKKVFPKRVYFMEAQFNVDNFPLFHYHCGIAGLGRFRIDDSGVT